MADIFLSYAREDLTRASHLATALAGCGWSVFWDRRIPIGKSFDEVIEKEIDAARCVIVLWSPHAIASHWVRAEAREAARREILRPVWVEDVRVPLEFRALQTARLVDWQPGAQHAEFDQLLTDITSTLGPAPVAAGGTTEREHSGTAPVITTQVEPSGVESVGGTFRRETELEIVSADTTEREHSGTAPVITTQVEPSGVESVGGTFRRETELETVMFIQPKVVIEPASSGSHGAEAEPTDLDGSDLREHAQNLRHSPAIKEMGTSVSEPEPSALEPSALFRDSGVEGVDTASEIPAGRSVREQASDPAQAEARKAKHLVFGSIAVALVLVIAIGVMTLIRQPATPSPTTPAPPPLPQSDTQALLAKGLQYDYGRGVEKDYAKAAEMYRLAADQGNAEAQYNLGLMYDDGRGVPKDAAEAAKWYRKAADQYQKAADQGEAKAQYRLGRMYDYGQGVPKDAAKAVKWYRKAADQGNVSAQNDLGVSYYFGRGVPKDDAEAVKWYRKAADQGDAKAQDNLADRYLIGRGVPKDDAEAAKWYRKAADQYQKAADQGDEKAQNRLGYMYAEGKGVPRDDAEAVKWWRKAADQGDASSQYNLGLMYANGRGVPKDDAEAVKWYRKATQQGDDMYARLAQDELRKRQ